MIDVDALQRAAARFEPPERSFERLVARRARKWRMRRIGTGVVGVVVAFGSFAGLVRAFRVVEPTVKDREGIFTDVRGSTDVHGWIAYNTPDDIWAIDPERPGDPDARVRLSVVAGAPLAWSRDGSTLLLLRAISSGGLRSDMTLSSPKFVMCLYVLRGDGTETRVLTVDAEADPLFTGSSLSPDGSQVAYVGRRPGTDLEAIYVIGTDGGRSQLLRGSWMEPYVIPELKWRGQLMWPAWSSDGTRIAYFHGGGDHSENLKVMNVDGTNAHSVFGRRRFDGHVQGLVWSPDDSRLAFAADDADGTWAIWTIGVDGSGLRRVISNAVDPSWSPDGSRIAFRRDRALFTVNADGSDVREIAEVSRYGDIAWNPVA